LTGNVSGKRGKVKMERARKVIREALDEAKSPAVFCSFGKDSVLLLHLVREIVPDVPVLWFRSGGDEKFAKQVIMELNLDIWSWQPSDVYVLPNDKGLSLVREQAFGQHRFPIILDIEEGTKCIGDFLPERTLQLFPHFDCLFLGYKETDEHWTLGGKGFCPTDGWELGRAKVYAPIRYLNDSQVWEAIKELGVPYDKDRYDNNAPDPDTLQACSLCLQAGEGKVFCPKEQVEIDRIVWDKAASLAAFRNHYIPQGNN
jgi:Phosphoadenosine phosphosulfate reductase family